jgi:hypothetical protein
MIDLDVMRAFDSWENETYPDGTPLSDSDIELWKAGYKYAVQKKLNIYKTERILKSESNN